MLRYEAVWRETIKTYHEMVAEEGWTTKNRIDVSAVQNLTFKVSQCILTMKNMFTYDHLICLLARTFDHRKMRLWISI